MTEKENTAEASVGPVTVSIARKIKPGKEAEYESWVRKIIQVGSGFPGHLGVDVLTPSARTGGDYVLLVRFDTYANQRAWEESQERANCLEALEDIAVGEARISKATGLETWFALPDLPVQAAPNKHKMALVLSVVVFLLVLLVNVLFADLLATLPMVLRVLIVSVVQVLLLTYLIMPRVTALLKRWLYPTSV